MGRGDEERGKTCGHVLAREMAGLTDGGLGEHKVATTQSSTNGGLGECEVATARRTADNHNGDSERR